MREILFRGKTFNGEWEYGVPVFSGLNNELAFMKQMHSYDHQVIPSTVGQYTGLTDKNGTKIFEGDVVKTKEFGRNNGNGVNFNAYDFFEVIYSSASFKLNNTHRLFNMTNGQKIEVIGNIHDNPELLGGGEE